MAHVTHISRDELQCIIKDAHIVDARADARFDAGHIPGALNASRLHATDLADGRPVVVYDEHEHDDAAMSAADQITRIAGRPIMIFDGGMREWRDANLPVTDGDADHRDVRSAQTHVHDDWKATEASMESFPASDPPGYR